MRVPIHTMLFRAFGAVLAPLTGCDNNSPQSARNELLTGTNAAAADFTNYSYDVTNVWPHDTNAFTQGLVFLDGALLESTGLNGQSTLRKVDLKTGRVLKRVEVPAKYFAEGLAVLGGKVFQLTYLDHKGFVYDLGYSRILVADLAVARENF